MSVQSRDLVVRLMAQSNGFEKGMKSAAASADVFARELEKMDQRQTANVAHVAKLRSKYEREMAVVEQRAAREAEAASRRRHAAYEGMGRGAMVAGGAVAVGLGLAARAAIGWESAWAGVTKTVDGSSRQMSVLEQDLRELAKTLPTTHTEIAAVAEAAGQLGIKRSAIVGFTKTMIDLGETTNLTADEAATGLARLMNVMGTAPEDVDRVASSLVALGNAGASTESEILDMAQRLSGAGKLIGASEADVLAMANAMSSMGIEAELGGGAMSRTLLNIEKSVAGGSDKIAGYAEVAGMSAQQFAEDWRSTPVQALDAFVQGLNRIDGSGGSAINALDELGIKGTQDLQVLLRLKGAQDLLSDSLDLGASSWQENNALIEEANKRYETTESRIKIARNNLNDFAIDLGGVLLPALAGVADGVTSVAQVLGDLPQPAKTALALLSTLTATVGLGLGGALLAVPKLAAFKDGLAALGVEAGRTDKAMRGMATVMKAGLVAGAILGLVLSFDQLTDHLAEPTPKIDALTRSLLQFEQTGTTSGVLTRSLGKDFEDLGATMDRASKNRASEFGKFLVFAGDWDGDIKSARNQIDGMDKALASLVESGHADRAANLYGQIAMKAREQGRSVDELRDLTGDYHEALAAQTHAQQESRDAAYEAAGAVDAASGAMTNAYDSLGQYAASLGMTEEETKALVDQTKAWGESLAGFVQPLGAYQDVLKRKEEAERLSAEKTAEATESQEDSWEDYAQAVSVSVGEYLAELETQVKAQEDWSANMTVLAGKVSDTTLDELARMGPEGAPLVAKLVSASDAELDKMDDLFLRRTREATSAQAEEWKLWGELAPQLTAKIGKDAVDGLGRELAKGTATVANIAAQYGIELADGINPILAAVGQRKVVLDQQAGRGYTGPQAFSVGGAVWGAGTSTSDSIQALLSNGEYVIRAESVGRYGHDFFDAVNAGRFARGGFVTGSDVPRPPSTKPYGPPISTAAGGTMETAYAAAMRAVQTLAPQLMSAAGGASATGLNPQFLAQFNAYNAAIGGVLKIVSGFRSRAQQAALYQRWGNRVPGQAPAAPPGRSNHERGLAIDHSPHSTPRMRAVAAAHGLRYPMSYEPWHVEPAAVSRGHARGGPVRRLAAGGPVSRATTARPAPRTLTAATRGLTDVSAIRAAAQAWEDHHAALVRNRALLADLVAAQRELAQARSTSAKDVAQAKREMDTDLKLAKTKADRAEAYKKYDDVVRNGAEARSDAYRNIAEAQQAIRDQQAGDALDRERAAVDRLVASLEREQQVRADKLSALNGMLDQERDIRARGLQAEQDHADKVARIQQRSAQAAAELRAQQQRLLDDRRDQLSGWARLDERATVQWGNSVEQLLANAREQNTSFEQWSAELAGARARGLSEQIIASLGLDEGPQALGQLRAFGQATTAQIDALNAEVARRTALAGQQTAREQQAGYGELGRGLLAAHQQYTEALAELDDELAQAQADLIEEQDQVSEDLKAIGQDQARSYGEALEQGLRSQVPAVLAAAQALQAAAGGATGNASMVGGKYVDSMTGRLAYYGPSGEPAYASAKDAPPGAKTHRMPDGRTAYYVPQKTYDVGGWLQPGYTLAYNGTGQPERVLTASQAAAGGGTGDVSVRVFIGDQELTDLVDVRVETNLSDKRDGSLGHGERS